jgi:hypothetical protein
VSKTSGPIGLEVVGDGLELKTQGIGAGKRHDSRAHFDRAVALSTLSRHLGYAETAAQGRLTTIVIVSRAPISSVGRLRVVATWIVFFAMLMSPSQRSPRATLRNSVSLMRS